jgi:hypothetical protein
MSAIYFAAILAALLFFLYMIVSTVRNAHNRRIAALGAVIGAIAGTGFVVVVALLIYAAMHFGGGDFEDFGHGLLAAVVVCLATAPALILGLIGCAIGARRGAAWRPDESLTPDNWSAPDTAEVQRLVAGRIIKPDADPT